MIGDGAWRVRTATTADRPAVANVLDGACLAIDPDRLSRLLDRGAVVLAVAGEAPNERILGALVLDGTEIAAVAVRRERRDQGIGTALVEAAADRRERLVAEFDADVRAFWEAVGFEIAGVGETARLRGVR